MEIRKDYVSLATASYKDLESVINDLTYDELVKALSLESQTNRRPSMIRRMIARLVRIKELEYKNQLEREYLSCQDKHPRS